MKILCILILLTVCAGCSNNTNPPEYIKEVVAYKEGSDGIIVYVVLADKDGNPTSSDGLLECFIEPKRKLSDGFASGLYEVKNLKQSDFSKLTIGIGSLERKVLAYSLDRIPYTKFGTNTPWERSPDLIAPFGRVRVTFSAKDGKQLKGTIPVNF